MGRLGGKLAAVTGGASGLAKRSLAEGASVAFCDQDGERG